jgi:hypothetical protein
MLGASIKQCYFLIFLLVCGCATTQGQRDYRNTHNKILKSNKEFQSCYTRIGRNPIYQILFDNLAIKGEKADLRALTNENEFAKQDKSLFLDFYAEHQVCDQQKLNNFGKIDGSLQLIAIKQLQARDNVFLGWIEAPSITYGQMNKDIERLREEERGQNVNWGNEYTKQLELKHRAEKANREKAKAEFKASVASTMEDIVNGLILLGMTQNSLAAQQQATNIQEQSNIQIRPITPTIISTTCRKLAMGTIHCTTF